MMSDNTERWRIEREKHPFFGESVSKSEYEKVWDDAADRYDDAGVGTLKDEIIQRIFDLSIIDSDTHVMDVGSGPGTYSIPFSERCVSVVCLDGSQKMLDRIISKGIGNIRCIRADWDLFDTDERFDVVFSSLCPALNNPVSLLKMESFSEGYCVYVSSMNDDTSSLRRDIWKEFGKDYSMNGYDTRFPFTFLKENGRTPALEVFETSSPSEMSESETADKEAEYFSRYMTVDRNVRSRIEDVIRNHAEDGIIHLEGEKRLGLLYWKPL